VSSSARGALLLLFDVAAAAIDEHDDWHTHEHMPERLAIPGFLRGSRWTRSAPGPRYCVLYEVAEPTVLDAPAYRARLEHPTPWTSRMMPHYVGMRRTLCEVVAGGGTGVGGACLVVTFAPGEPPGATPDLRRLAEALTRLDDRRGIAAWRLLRHALPAGMTREQALRGRDGAVHSALWVTGYEAGALEAVVAEDLGAARLAQNGVIAVDHAVFGLAHLLAASGG
jgi:hypothetical protein